MKDKSEAVKEKLIYFVPNDLISEKRIQQSLGKTCFDLISPSLSTLKAFLC